MIDQEVRYASSVHFVRGKKSLISNSHREGEGLCSLMECCIRRLMGSKGDGKIGKCSAEGKYLAQVVCVFPFPFLLCSDSPSWE